MGHVTGFTRAVASTIWPFGHSNFKFVGDFSMFSLGKVIGLDFKKKVTLLIKWDRECLPIKIICFPRILHVCASIRACIFAYVYVHMSLDDFYFTDFHLSAYI